MKIIPSIASANPLALASEIDRLGEIGSLHIDIEDGNFCPSMTFGLDTVRAIASHTSAELDAHLMVTNPMDYIQPLCDCGFTHIAAHFEALPYPAAFLGKVQSMGIHAGLALNLKTGLSTLEGYTDQLDYILLLTNEPDCKGLKFREYSLRRFCDLRKILPAHISLWADGGVTKELLPALVEYGADTAIMGRAIFASQDPEASYRQMMAIANREKYP